MMRIIAEGVVHDVVRTSGIILSSFELQLKVN
jgi:hypothetical protein